MSSIHSSIIIIAVLVLSSCQKEIDWGLGGNNTELLVKTVSKTGNDSTVTNYTYDGSQRLIREKISGIAQGIDLDNDLKIYRATDGVITRTVQASALLAGTGVDSIVTRFNYNAGTKRYTSSLVTLTVLGVSVTDSTVFRYDATGHLNADEHYQSFMGLPYVLSLKQEYTYAPSGNSVLTVKQSLFNLVSGNFTPVSELNATYDTKVNPLRLSTNYEGVILSRPNLFSPYNASRLEFTDASNAGNN
jgi:YD repeat-containing protein